MNYQRIYLCIVLRAQCEHNERKANKKNNGAYYEVHHILPRSLGGNNDKSNLALLTAREHFICHWLLVKIYPKGSDCRRKMLYAFWRMHANPSKYMNQRYLNSRAYDLLRSEYKYVISKSMSEKQTGRNNSQYGTHWYTNAYNGQCIKSKELLDYPWMRGKNLFHGESNRISGATQYRCGSVHILKPTMKTYSYTIMEMSRLAKQQVFNEWDRFHTGQYSSLGDWGREHGTTYQAIRKRFLKYIPIFSELLKHGVSFASNKSLVGVYEKDGQLDGASSGLIFYESDT